MTPLCAAEGVTVWNGDAIDAYREYADSAFGLLWLDPPYHRVKMDEAWDRQWATDADYFAWLGLHTAEWQRLLAPNGSLYVCASPQMAWGVEGVLRERFNVLNRITWEKASSYGQIYGVENFRHYLDSPEVIFFCEHPGADNIAKGEAGYAAKCDELRGFVFEPLRAYLAGERDRAGIENGAINAAWCELKGVNSTSQTQKWFSSSCFNPPTAEAYQWLRDLLNRTGGEYLRREYEDLRREYEDLRREYEDLRRPFNATPEHPFTSVWHYQTVGSYAGKHPCEKPYEMVRDVVRISSRAGMLCGDFFAGSGVFGRACRDLGRDVVLCDQDEEWARKSAERAMGPPLLRLIDEAAPEPTQAGLF